VKKLGVLAAQVYQADLTFILKFIMIKMKE
jgi:hypothetical protein